MGKTSILIVEDESIIAEELGDTLSTRGYDIQGPASSGKQAIELARLNRPDLILMDIRIEGDLNGMETAIVIESIYADNPIPLIYLTALPSSKFPLITGVGPYIYVNKPISEKKLFDAIERALQKKEKAE